MSIRIARLCCYPVKGLSPQDLPDAALEPGEGLPNDRRFAIAHGAGWYDHANPGWQSKRHFLILMTHERLAALETLFDAATGMLTIKRGGRQVASGDITGQIGRDLINQFFAAYMAKEAIGAPKLVEAPGVMFTDNREKLVSIINLASAKDLERVTRRPVDPVRFRGNLMIAGDRPWQDFDWIGRDLAIGDARLSVVDRIGRCAATNVDPATGERDMNIPMTLIGGFGHGHCGVYAKVTAAGKVAVGDQMTVV